MSWRNENFGLDLVRDTEPHLVGPCNRKERDMPGPKTPTWSCPTSAPFQKKLGPGSVRKTIPTRMHSKWEMRHRVLAARRHPRVNKLLRALYIKRSSLRYIVVIIVRAPYGRELVRVVRIGEFAARLVELIWVGHHVIKAPAPRGNRPHWRHRLAPSRALRID
jgi:hypothetical protein